jgi:hypothetical protein
MNNFHYNQDPLYTVASSILKNKELANAIQEETLAEASAGTTLDDFRSEQEIIAALLKLPGVKDHLRKIKAKPYFDDGDFVVASKTAIGDALFSPDIKLADLAKAVMASEGDFAKPEKEAMPNRVIVSVDNEASVNKLLDLIKTNNAKASSKDMKVKAQKFARKDGFKVYITGNSTSAIGQYKKLAEESDLYEDITLEEETESITEVLDPDAEASVWIDDFVKSDDPKFDGKSKDERIKMALGAWYAAQKKESVEAADDSIEEVFRPGRDMVPAPIGKDTVTSQGLKKLWGVQMRAGKWADTFVGLWDDSSDKPFGIIDAEGVTRYADISKFMSAFSKLKEDVATRDLGGLEEGVGEIEAHIAKYKVGDKTNFGVVTDIGSNSISFKAKDLPVTKIAFNQRKMGSKDFVLDKLVKLKEGVELEEAYKVGFPLTKKAIKVATDLDADEFEEFLGGMADYFHELDAGDEGISVRVTTQIAIHFEQAYKIWKNR